MDIGSWWPTIGATGFFVLIGSTVIFQWKLGAGQASTNTINILKAQDDAQQKLIDGQTKKIQELTIQITRLEAEVKEKDVKLAEFMLIFQGRDKDTREYQRKGLVAISQQIPEILKISAQSGKNIERMYELMIKHFDRLEKNGAKDGKPS